MNDDGEEYEFRDGGGNELRVVPHEGGYRLVLSLSVEDPELVDDAYREAFAMEAAAARYGNAAKGVALADRAVGATLDLLLAELPAGVRETLVALLAFRLYDRDPDDDETSDRTTQPDGD